MLALLGMYNFGHLPLPSGLEMPQKNKAFGRRLQMRCASAPAVLCRASNRPSKRKN